MDQTLFDWVLIVYATLAAGIGSLAAYGRGRRALRLHGHPHRHLEYALEPHVHQGYADLQHEHPHDHPHSHDHVQHTHTLEKRSEHEEAGKKVTVKVCADCGTVFRDRQE